MGAICEGTRIFFGGLRGDHFFSLGQRGGTRMFGGPVTFFYKEYTLVALYIYVRSGCILSPGGGQNFSPWAKGGAESFMHAKGGP